jgi:hypothetical protein
MTTIFEALRNDHEIQRSLIARLLDTVGASEERQATFAELRVELSAHADNEERYFYVPLMLDDLTQEKARHSVSEHKELEDFVEKLDEYQFEASQWLMTARDLEQRLTHHLDEEEHEVFQLAGKVLSDRKKTELAAAYQAAMHGSREHATA